MKIIGFDTTTSYLSICIINGQDVIDSMHEDMKLRHSSQLIPIIDTMFKHSGLVLQNIDGIAVSIGPGSFTGLRIAVATAKALSLATGIPVVGVPTLDAIVHNYIGINGYIAPILDARKNRVYSAFYSSKNGCIKRISDYILTDIESLLRSIKHKIMFIGDGVNLYKSYIKEKAPIAEFSLSDKWYPSGKVIAEMGMSKMQRGLKDDVDRLVPLYLYPKECNVRGFKF